MTDFTTWTRVNNTWVGGWIVDSEMGLGQAAYSSRGRIGLVVIDSDIIAEPESRRVAPEEVEVFATRVTAPVELPKVEYLTRIAQQARDGVRALVPTRPSAIIFG